MKFAQPLWLIGGVLACVALLWRYRRFDRKQATLLTQFIAPRLAEQLTRSFSPQRRTFKRGLFVVATACLFLALARPQAGFRWEETQRKGLEILFAVDTSRSMLAQDVKPSRLTRAKLAVEDLLGNLNGDGVGLVAFAGGSFLQCPITLDYDAFRDSLAALDTGIIPKGGTDVAAAIREAQAAFKTRASSDHILILLTDGEDLEGEAIAAAKAAASEGVKIFTVGVGSANGELVPVPGENGGTEFVKDESGQFVKSRLDESALKEIAAVTGGMYQPLGQQSQGLTAIYEQGLKSFTRHDLSSRQHKVYLEQFYWPLLAALALLISESLIGTRRRGPGHKRSPMASAGTLRPALVASLIAVAVAAAPAISHASPGSAEQAYQKGNFTQAAKDYAVSAQKQPAKAELQFNLGAAAYKSGEFAASGKAFESALKTEKLPVQQSAYYNLGNTQYRTGQQTEQANPQETIKTWESAVQSYEAALQLKPDDADAKYNRDFVKRKLEELKQQQQPQKDQAQQKDQQDQNQDQPSDKSEPDQKQNSKPDQANNGSDQNQQQDQKNQSGQPDQNQSGQDKQDSKPDQNQQANKGGDQDKQDQKNQAGSGQDQPKQPDADKSGQQQADAGKGQKSQDQKPEQQAKNGSPAGPKQPSKGTPEANGQPDQQPGEEQAQAGERREPGQMTKEEAKNLLDSLKGEERKVNAGQMARGAAPRKTTNRNVIGNMKPATSLSNMTRSIIALALGLALAATGRAANASVSATLDPSRITLDDAAQLVVSVQGSRVAEPQLPEVDGLDFTPVGQSSSFQSINGAVTANVSFVYQVTATKAGTFHIPAIKAGSASSRPVQLQVVATRNGGAGQRAPSLGRALPPPNVNLPSGNDAPGSANGSPAFLHVVTPKPELYVGELVPVQIKAYFRRGLSASLNGLPVLNSDAFTMSKLPQPPEQSQELVDGQPYTVVTWTTALAPVKAGDYTLNLELPVMVRVQDRSARAGGPFGSMFDDSFFNDFFGRVSEKPITLKTDLAAIKVLPLPTADRPADFSGAVGQFDIHGEATPTSAAAGEPVTLKLTIHGTGNFDRVNTTGVPDGAELKTYKPAMQFEPADNAGLQGKKIFEQAVVPQAAGQVQIPPVAFSYFDPAARKYVTQPSEPIALQIAPGNVNPATVAAAPPPTAPAATVAASTVGAAELKPNAVAPGSFVGSLQPVLFQAWFPFALAAPWVLLGVGLWYAKRRAHTTATADFAVNEVALRESLDRMERASQSGAVTTFFISARHALQERLAQIWQVPPHAVTVAEINTRLKDTGAEIRTIFQAADQAAYAGHGFAPVDLSHWRQVVHTQLKLLEKL